MKGILFALPGNEKLAQALTDQLKLDQGEIVVRKFPDGETYVQVKSAVAGREVTLLCTLRQPDEHLLPLFFLSKTLREFGCSRITLIAPYLAYMRQDKEFNPGEAVSSKHFASLLSSFVDELVTIDPHLHRIHALHDIYPIPSKTLHASRLIAAYIRGSVDKALLIGPDEESEQWVSEIASEAGAPFVILEKQRMGDRDVSISIPRVEEFHDHIPVLVDDIISTAHTMIETIRHLKTLGMKEPTCIAVHALFAGNAYEELKAGGAGRIVTCNTIPHVSNAIDISPLIVKGLIGVN